MRGTCARISLLVCALLWTERPAAALDPFKPISHYMHRRWDAEQDLPVNAATALLQSRAGYLWIGSREGLVRYDGVTFTKFDSGNTPCLKDKSILRLAAMPDDSIWVIPVRGVPVRMKDGVFACDPLLEGAPHTLIKAIVPAAGGGAWFGAFGEGVFLIRAGRVIRAYRGQPFDKLSSAKVVDLAVGRDGALWVATNGGGVNRVGPDGTIAVFNEESGLSSNSTTRLFEARDGTMWVGTSQGVTTILGDRVEHIARMPSLMVSALIEDKRGAMWIGTEDGLYRLYDGVVRAYGRRGGSASDTVQVQALLEDREGNLWMGSTGGGIERFSDGPFEPYTSTDGLSDDFVWTVYEDVPGRIWIGTDAGGLNRLEHDELTTYGRAEGLGDDTVRSTLRARDGTLWVGTLRSGLKRFDGETFIAVAADDPRCESDIPAIAENADGELWVAARSTAQTTNGVLCRLRDGKLHVIGAAQGGVEDSLSCMVRAQDGRLLLCGARGLHIIDRGRTTTYSTHDGLSSNFVTAVYEDQDRVLWIGTEQGGLNRFKDGVFAHATTAHGLFDDQTHAIVEDDAGDLWLSSSRGISRVHKRDLQDLLAGRRTRVEPTVYGVEHGMRTVECNGGAQYSAWRASNGRLWFVTRKGVVVVDPRRVETNAIQPQVIIERVTADGVDWSRKPGRALAPGIRALEFTYTATSLISSNRVHFKYKLEGFDSDWVDAANRRTAYYTNLPPGAYRFRVIAANSDGLWNEEGASVAFTLKPYLYQTWWFLVASTIVGFGLVIAVHRLRVRRLRHSERELQVRVEDRTREIAEAAQALRASETYSRAIVGNVGEGIITFDGAGRISRWNAAAERIFSFSAEEAVGNTAALLGLDGASVAFPSAPASSVVEHARRKDGALLPIEIHATAANIDGNAMTIWLVRDLTEARRAEAKVAAMQRELIAASRRAGMAQVATSVLHNVGNALTSVNVSAELVLGTLRRSKVAGLSKAAAMLEREPAELVSFLTETEQGRKLPVYLLKVNEFIQNEHKAAIDELESMGRGIEHIKAIVSAQQSHGKVAGVFELVVLSELLNDAVRLERGLCEMANIVLRVQYDDLPQVRVDRHRLLEIIMNLLVNAREALGELAAGEKREILVRTRLASAGTFSIEVSDSGVGIAAADLIRIFNQGFTTKPDGHGFGLHSSSCAAVELGGHLIAQSAGAGKGACFILTLPIEGASSSPKKPAPNPRLAASTQAVDQQPS